MDPRTFAHELLMEYRDEILRVAQDLIRIPSRNMPPGGEELACQEHLAAYLRRAGLPVDLYEPDQVPGLVEHPAFWPGRDYRNRPNLSSRLPGRGGGRSLLLSGHMDTVSLGDVVWTHPPFAAEIRDGRLYGLGAIDMKAAMAAMAVLYRAIAAIAEKGVRLRGALSYECVVDEEEGGVNATIAGRLRDGAVDAALIPEGTDLKIYPAARGALISDIIFTGTQGAWLDVGKRAGKTADAVRQIGIFLTHLDELAALRRSAASPTHPLYASYPDPVPVQVTKVYAGGWGNQVPIAVPPEGRIELIMQTLPGETREAVHRQMTDWLDSVIARHEDDFVTRPEIRHRLRWMVPTAIEPNHPLVTAMAACAGQVTGSDPAVLGAPFSCDMFALHQIFHIPGIIFGPAGANAHAADEYVDIESLFTFWEALLLFVMNWCGAEM